MIFGKTSSTCADWIGNIRCVLGNGIVGSRTGAIPGFLFRVTFPAEQYVFAFGPAWRQNCHGFGLGKARQVVEIAILTIGIQDVPVAQPGLGGRKNCN